jgi:DNA (cytosine-5)-methyltransferase 1
MAVDNVRTVSNKSVSLFSSAGIGDLGIEYGCKLPVCVFSELKADRAALLEKNYPNAKVIVGDIWEKVDDIVNVTNTELSGASPKLVTLSPPCQGMSSNGKGKMNSARKKGKKPEYDSRNLLILPSLEIVEKLLPQYFLIENAPIMMDTEILVNKKPITIGKVIEKRLSKNYKIHSFKLDFAKYGVPQFRLRSITIGIYHPNNKSKISYEIPDWFDSGKDSEIITIRKALCRHTRTSKSDPYHQAVTHNDEMTKWISNISPYSGQSAHFNSCEFCDAPAPEKGVVFCQNPSCGKLLPRPNKDGRAIIGFKTSYKRFDPDKPSSTVTMNSGSPSSDTQIHYSEDRTNTIREVMILTTFLYRIISKRPWPWIGKYSFEGHITKKQLTQGKNMIRDAMGEAIPPLAMYRMITSLFNWGEKNE